MSKDSYSGTQHNEPDMGNADMPTSGNTNLYFEAHKPVFFNKNLYFLKTYTNRLPLPHFITRIVRAMAVVFVRRQENSRATLLSGNITFAMSEKLSEDVNGMLCSTTYKVHSVSALMVS